MHAFTDTFTHAHMHRPLHIYVYNPRHIYVYIPMHIHSHIHILILIYILYTIVLNRCSSDRRWSCIMAVTIIRFRWQSLLMDPQHTAMEQAALQLPFPKNYVLFYLEHDFIVVEQFHDFGMGVMLLLIHIIAFLIATTMPRCMIGCLSSLHQSQPLRSCHSCKDCFAHS